MSYTFSFQFLGTYGRFFLDGLLMTLELSVFAVLLGTLFGTLMGLLRVSTNKLLKFLSGGLAQAGDAHGFALMGLWELFHGTTHVIAACADEAAAAGAKGTLLSRQSDLHPVILSPVTRESLIAIDPALAEYPLPGAGVQWYVCKDGVCAAKADVLHESI